MNLILFHLRDGLLPEGLEKINATLNNAGRTMHPWLEARKPKPAVAAGPFQRSKLDDIRPPSWWKPERENWAGIQSFLKSGKGLVNKGPGL